MTSFKLASVCFLLFYNILPVTSGAIVHSGTNEVNNNAGEKVWPSIFPILFPQNSITACLNDEDGPKFLNGTCQTDKDCFGGGVSMVCKKQLCACNAGYVPEDVELSGNVKEIICIQAPFLFQPCSTVCQKPLNCTENSVTTPDVHVLRFRSITGKSCQCLSPFKFQDGVCFLECNDDDYFVEDRCLKKCKPNEVRLKDYRCLPLASLGSHCEADYQCEATFSECRDSVCSCQNGFQKDGSFCKSSVHNCPIGQPLTEGSTVIQCKTNRLFSPLIPSPSGLTLHNGATESDEHLSFMLQNNLQLKDTCPNTHFCLVTGLDSGLEVSGHCCPKPKLSCPVGSPNTNAVCLLDPAGQLPYCPYDTHYCHFIVVGTYSDQVCCPKACADGLVLVDGKCYPLVLLHDECTVDVQCKNHNGFCSEGRCNCSAQAKPMGSKPYLFCQIECGADEVLYENQCYQRLKLGDSCNSTNNWMCPFNAVCKKNVCSCLCGLYPISDSLCGPLPVCSNVQDENILRPVEEPALTDFSVREAFTNATFCKVSSPHEQTRVVRVVDTCTDGHYCSNYMANLGLCCKKPEPTCPNGHKPESIENCNTNLPSSCGPNKFCHRFIYPADLNSQEGFVCCPLERSSVFVPVELPPPQVPIKLKTT